MAESEDVDMPMAWLWAEQTAENLIAHADGSVSPATFGFRATRDVLALTLLLTGIAHQAGGISTSQLELIRDHLSVDTRWSAWCQSRLDGTGTVTTSTDLDFARDAWHWLARSRMLPAPEGADPLCAEILAVSPGAGCGIGLQEARRIITSHLNGPSWYGPSGLS